MSDERIIRRLNVIIVLLVVPYVFGAMFFLENVVVWALLLVFGAVALLFFVAVARGIRLQ